MRFQTSELLSKFLYNYSIMWESMDIWFVLFKKKILHATSFEPVVLKKIISPIFKKPNGPAQSMIIQLKKQVTSVLLC